MNLSWLDGILPILRWAVNGTSKGTPLAVNLTGVGVTSTVTDDTLTVNFEGSGGSGGNTTAEYLLTTADGTTEFARADCVIQCLSDQCDGHIDASVHNGHDVGHLLRGQ